MKKIYSIIYLFLFLLLVTTSYSKDNNLIGLWKTSGTKKAITLKFYNNGVYHWNKEKGRFAVQNSLIWFLSEGAGTKWEFFFNDKKLILKNPEDFKYLGSGRYIYFQMINPNIIHIFKQVKEKK